MVGKIKNVNTIHRHMDLATDTLTFTVKASIVE
jgi:ssRNA-specific RNase YbeY (16S rRNA maturation enzyme)